ncbi:arginine--tRNA ligase [endosymbiont of Sipalinus gigas]|uniref:arginine--tRNA ligase n=1 Tax=endosymbiont of Sipalinus gigas TaxID=1972134 RepID=UPI000DC70409|nr:arginine--tRNA ligase [endosymbiont of Sipalinus gigas]BBA85362.1 arginine--tRNA ligase [endosymbiont of Sipalinus gigas]
MKNKIMINIKESIINDIYNIFNLYKINIIKKKIILRESKLFGDYKIDGIFNILKNISNKDILLNKIIEKIKKNKFIEKVILINNFINIYLSNEYIENNILNMLCNKFNINKKINTNTIVIDYSSPNMAKELHIGHIRSTFIGDSISNILKFIGNKVIKVSHIGDWGINFGMIIYEFMINGFNEYSDISIYDIEKLYIKSRIKYLNDKNFNKNSNIIFKKLQDKNTYITNIWNKIIKISIMNILRIYKIMNISLKLNNIIGESYYQKFIPEIIDDLTNKNILKEYNGSKIIFLKKFKNKENKIMGIILQKKDGTYLYSSTEIASIKYRLNILKANKIIYYVDSRQSDHIKFSYEISKIAGYIPKNSYIEHHIFGMILNKDNKPFKTRDGDLLKLIDIIKEVKYKIKKDLKYKIKCKRKINNIVNNLSIGSIKYFELSKNRFNNYIFKIDNIISINKNTFFYIQYTYIRICSLINKYKIKNKKNISDLKVEFKIYNKYERDLAINIINFEEKIILSGNNGLPNILCDYIYMISTKFSIFYEKCKILETNTINSKLNLIILTSKIIKISLNLLGIKTLNKI